MFQEFSNKAILLGVHNPFNTCYLCNKVREILKEIFRLNGFVVCCIDELCEEFSEKYFYACASGAKAESIHNFVVHEMGSGRLINRLVLDKAKDEIDEKHPKIAVFDVEYPEELRFIKKHSGTFLDQFCFDKAKVWSTHEHQDGDVLDSEIALLVDRLLFVPNVEITQAMERIIETQVVKGLKTA